MHEEENNFYYPDNLNAKTTVIGWEWWAIIIISLGFVISLAAISAAKLFLPFLFTAVFAFLTFKVGDTSIYKQVIIFANYFFAEQMVYLLDSKLKVSVPIFYKMKRSEKNRGEKE